MAKVATSRLRLAGILAVALALGYAGLVLGDLGALGTAPALLLFALLSCSWFPGERTIARLAAAVRRRRRRRAVSDRPRPAAPRVLACIGGGLQQGFARRPPPALA